MEKGVKGEKKCEEPQREFENEDTSCLRFRSSNICAIWKINVIIYEVAGGEWNRAARSAF